MDNIDSVSGSEYPQPTKKVADPDAETLLALARGETDALGKLMSRHLAAVKSTAWHMLGDEMIAEDIAQEVFLRAWKQAPNWQAGQAKFSTWLYRVTKNLCYDRLRKKTEIYLDTVPDIMDNRPEAAQALANTQTLMEQKTKIEGALLHIPERQRMAITLCHYRELSQNDAAEIMDIGVRAYESLLARGRKSLRAQLEKYRAELL